jgi:hypothetical protein
MPLPPMPARGEVVFHAKCIPALEAADYEFRVGQSMRTSGNARLDAGSQPLPPEQIYPFTVDGPRFTLDASLIHGVFPPTNGVGAYVSRLPMIVLRRRTIPWERTLPGAPETPWLAVLLFEENEVTTVSPCTVNDVLDTGGLPHRHAPAIAGVSAATRAQPCIAIEIALDLFRDIAPMAIELPLLSHVRQVNTEDKELMGMDDDGWFAVVVGNRIPEPGKKYVACLVPLEGVQALLPTAAQATALTAADLRQNRVAEFTELATKHMKTAVLADDTVDRGAVRAGLIQQMVQADNAYAAFTVDPASSPKSSISSVGASNADRWTDVEPVHATKTFGKVGVLFLPHTLRLFCLAQWKFECLKGGDFESIMQALPNNGGVAALGMPPALAQAPGGTPAAAWRAALDTGHVPLEHLTREGERTIAWYRGALTPVGVTRSTEGPYHTADQARRLDPATGLENLGYAAAFEIGRLLALGDPRFALDLLQWRRGDRSLLDVKFTFDVLNRFASVLARDIRFERNMLMTVPSFLATNSNVRFGIVMAKEARGGLGVMRDPTGLRELRTQLPGLTAPAISRAFGMELSLATSLVDGVMVGGGAVLDAIGVTTDLRREANLDTLALNPAQHFSPLNDAFRSGFRGLTGETR